MGANQSKEGSGWRTRQNQKKTGPLDGLKVVDLSHIMAGPACSMLLADMGADVIKVEKIPGGDDSRRMVPPTMADESAAFLIMNRNKRGIALNLKTEEGRDVLTRLLKNADVVIENYRRGTMEKMGFGYDIAARAKSQIDFLLDLRFRPHRSLRRSRRIRSGRAGHERTDEHHRRKTRRPADEMLERRSRISPPEFWRASEFWRRCTRANPRGQGQMVDTSLFEAGITHTYWHSAICFATGKAPGPMGSAHPLNGPYQAFPASDGWITVGAANQENWLRLVGASKRRSCATIRALRTTRSACAISPR